jgi:4-hydroxy-4-methyl-2-oxoglutarate aldolase
MYVLNPLPPPIDPQLLDLLVQAEPAVIGHFRYTGFMCPGIRALL